MAEGAVSSAQGPRGNLAGPSPLTTSHFSLSSTEHPFPVDPLLTITGPAHQGSHGATQLCPHTTATPCWRTAVSLLRATKHWCHVPLLPSPSLGLRDQNLRPAEDHSQKKDAKGQRLSGLQRSPRTAADAANHCNVPSFVPTSHTKKS